MASAHENIVSFREARALVEREAATLTPPRAEELPLRNAGGRILAAEIRADRDLPPFNRSTRDGYALRAAETSSPPVRLRVVGEIAAGFKGQLPRLNAGESIAIMTGAPLPPGADAVVMVEHTRLDGSDVQVERAVTSGENIVATGAEARHGDLLLTPGTLLDYSAISAAATVGAAQVNVYRKPRIAVISTGDEVVEVAKQPGEFEIRNSNAWSLAAQIERCGGEPVVLEIARDEVNELRSRIKEGLQSDLLLLSGGVSMGKHDLVESVLRELGAEFYFTGAKIQPGKPVVFGRAQGSYLFGLPGNPLSTMVCFDLFARVLVEKLGGRTPRPLRYMTVKLRSELKVKPGLTRFLPARLLGSYDQLEAEAMPWQGSGDVATMARADGWIVTEVDLAAGASASFLSKD